MSAKTRLQRIIIICFTVCTLIGLLLAFFIDSSSAASYGNYDAEVIISEDGSVEGTNLLQRSGDVYTLIGDIIISRAWSPAGIQVLKDNIIIDGAGHSVTINGDAMRGVDLSGRSGVTVKNLNIEGFNQGVYLDGSKQNTIQNNVIVGSNKLTSCGVWVNLSPSNKIVGNTITCGKNSSAVLNYGILIQVDSTGNLIDGNIIKNSETGISLSACPNNTLRNNQLTDNTQGLTVGYSSIEPQDIDTSNRIDGKPIYYWINQQDRTVPSDAGFIALGNCKNINIKDLKTETCILFNTCDSTITGNTLSVCTITGCKNIDVTKNTFAGNGIKITSCDNLKLTQNSLNNCGDGITTSGSTNLLISKNNITNNNAGIQSVSLKQSTITNNFLAYNTYGINAVSCSGNLIVENTFIENKQGALRLSGSNNNTLYHNNFIHNTDGCQIVNPWIVLYVSESNVWDNGSEGNYWSDLKSRFPNATQNVAGLWDTAYYINSQNYDRYPLINQYALENSVSTTVEPSGGQAVYPEDRSMTLFLLPTIVIIACTVSVLVYLFVKKKR